LSKYSHSSSNLISPGNNRKEKMEKHTNEYYTQLASINRGMGIEYDIEFHKMQDEMYYNMYMNRFSVNSKSMQIHENSKYIFITINPNSRIELLDFIKKIEKMMSKKWITNYLYVYEQRGETEDEMGKGFHYHGILEKPTKPYSHMIRELSNSMNSICDTSNFHFFNIKSISEEECQRKIIYITAQKADVEKHKKQDMDIVWRQKNNLKSFYNIGII